MPGVCCRVPGRRRPADGRSAVDTLTESRPSPSLGPGSSHRNSVLRNCRIRQNHRPLEWRRARLRLPATRAPGQPDGTPGRVKPRIALRLRATSAYECRNALRQHRVGERVRRHRNTRLLREIQSRRSRPRSHARKCRRVRDRKGQGHSGAGIVGRDDHQSIRGRVPVRRDTHIRFWQMRSVDAEISWPHEPAILPQHISTLRNGSVTGHQPLIIGAVVIDQPPVEPRVGAIHRDPLVNHRGPIERVGNVRVKTGLAEIRSKTIPAGSFRLPVFLFPPASRKDKDRRQSCSFRPNWRRSHAS